MESNQAGFSVLSSRHLLSSVFLVKVFLGGLKTWHADTWLPHPPSPWNIYFYVYSILWVCLGGYFSWRSIKYPIYLSRPGISAASLAIQSESQVFRSAPVMTTSQKSVLTCLSSTWNQLLCRRCLVVASMSFAQLLVAKEQHKRVVTVNAAADQATRNQWWYLSLLPTFLWLSLLSFMSVLNILRLNVNHFGLYQALNLH